MTIALREAVLADLDLLTDFEQLIFAEDAWSSGMVHGELTGIGRHYIVAEIDAVPVGYAGAFLGDAAEIMTIGVLPDFRGQGVGAAMLANVLEAAQRAGCREAYLEVRPDNSAAIALYERFGFSRLSVRRDYYGRGVDALVMQRTLR